MAELAALITAPLEFTDVVQSALDLTERLVVAPYLELAVRDGEHVEQHARIGASVDRSWAEEVAASIYDSMRAQAPRESGGDRGSVVRHLGHPVARLMTFPAHSRSGRSCAVTLASPRPLLIQPDEEALLLRLARQILLVLDHALLLQELESAEVTDGLTGIANQRRLLETIEYEIVRHRHFGRRLAIVVLDVEGLDGINRSYGRHYGNHVLQRLAALLRESVRPVDTVARYGLDEFAVLLPETDEDDGHGLAERLRDALLSAEFAGGAVGVSVGVAHAGPDETISADGLLRRAEGTMQTAKRQERDWTLLLQPSRRLAR